MPEKLIPARYIGNHEVLLDIGQLKSAGRPIVNGYGEPLQPLVTNAVTQTPAYGLRYGDTFMMPEGEILGKTYLHFQPPQPEQNSSYIGAGKVIMKEHEGQSLEALRVQGFDYEFQSGRVDFEPFILENASVTHSEPQQTPLNVEPVNMPVTSVETAVEPVVNNMATQQE